MIPKDNSYDQTIERVRPNVSTLFSKLIEDRANEVEVKKRIILGGWQNHCSSLALGLLSLRNIQSQMRL
jgi:hypothetical protein